MSASLYKWIVVASNLGTFVPLSIFFVRFQSQPKQNKIIAALLGLSVFLDLTQWGLYFAGLPTLLIANAYMLASFPILLFYYHQILFVRRLKALAYFLGLLFLNVSLYLAITKGLLSINNYIWATSSAILAVTSTIYFCYVPSMTVERYLDKYLFSTLIINASLSLYFFTSLIIFAFMDIIFNNLSIEQSRTFYSIHNITSILKNLGIAVGFLIAGNRNVYITFEQFQKMDRSRK